MVNRDDPLDSIPSGVEEDETLPPAPDSIEFSFPLVSKRTKEDLENFGVNMLGDYRDFKEKC